MGDALAISLLEKRGFTSADFARTHPGGLLGKKLLLSIDELMHTGNAIPKVNYNTMLKAALDEMTQKKLGITTIVHDDNALAGIFTDGDVRRALNNNADIQTTFIHQVMTQKPKVIRRGLLAAEALRIMETNKITSLVVVDEKNHPIGIIHLHDIFRAGVM